MMKRGESRKKENVALSSTLIIQKTLFLHKDTFCHMTDKREKQKVWEIQIQDH